MADDIWWKVYKKFLIDIKMRNKTLLGYFLLSAPPMATLAIIALFAVPDKNIKIFILALDALGLVVIVYWANVFARNISRQITDLSRDAKVVADGNYEHKIEVDSSNDEVGELVNSVKKMMQNLTGSLQSIISIMDGLGEAVFLTDNDFKITQFNPSAEKLLGYSEGELVGKPCYEIVKYVGIEAACHTPDCSSVKIMEGRENLLTRQVSILSKEGEEIPVEINTSPFLDAQGNCIGVVKLIKDLREVKAREAEIVEAKEQLEYHVERLLPSVLAAAEGDLTNIIHTDKDDAFGKLVNAFGDMVRSLNNLVLGVIELSSSVSATAEDLASSSEEMNATAEEMSSSVQQIAHGAQDQVHQLSTASVEMKKMADMIQSIAASAQSATEVADTANQIAQEGGKAAGEAVSKMREANEVVNKSSDTVKELGQASKEIGEIVGLITNIAEQTNLLALNAAIEAARAGEHGRGFAVVAEEVSKLAEGSAKAAKQIADIIKEMQEGMDTAVTSMEQGTEEVNEATEVVNEALGALETILQGVAEVTVKVEEISAAAQSQTITTETVVKAIEEITVSAEEAAATTEEVSAATEEQTANMQEIASTAQKLATLAARQGEVTSKFKIKKEEHSEEKSENSDEQKD